MQSCAEIGSARPVASISRAIICRSANVAIKVFLFGTHADPGAERKWRTRRS